VRLDDRLRGHHQGSEDRWDAMSALSSRPFCSCDGRRVSLGDLSAAARYTTPASRTAISVVSRSTPQIPPWCWPVACMASCFGAMTVGTHGRRSGKSSVRCGRWRGCHPKRTRRRDGAAPSGRCARGEFTGCLVNFRNAVPIYMTRGAPVGHDSSVANYRKQESLGSQAIDFPMSDFRFLP